MTAATALLLVHAAATCFMLGLIWFVQVVHYPLFARVDAPGYPAYQTDHMARTGRVVGPVMVAELFTGAALVLLRPAGVSGTAAGVGLALILAIWLSTALVQAPLHARLRSGFDPDLGARLVATNWLRTALWSVRAALALLMLAGAIGR